MRALVVPIETTRPPLLAWHAVSARAPFGPTPSTTRGESTCSRYLVHGHRPKGVETDLKRDFRLLDTPLGELPDASRGEVETGGRRGGRTRNTAENRLIALGIRQLLVNVRRERDLSEFIQTAFEAWVKRDMNPPFAEVRDDLDRRVHISCARYERE